jgi:two-component system, cell cycle response regulator DivK
MTAFKGIELANINKPDFILLDIQLPDMDGTQVLRTIRQTRELDHIPIIAITSYAMTGDRERLLEDRCYGYIEKPIDPETLEKTVHDITHPDDCFRGQNVMHDLLAGVIKTTSFEKRYLHKNGTTIDVHLTSTLMRNSEGQPLFFFSQPQDTPRKSGRMSC